MSIIASDSFSWLAGLEPLVVAHLPLIFDAL